jgi:hypothetical protein
MMSQNVERARALKLARKLMENNGRSESELNFATDKLNQLMTTFNLSLNEIVLANLDYKQITVEGVQAKGDPMNSVVCEIARFTDTKVWRQLGDAKRVNVRSSWRKRGGSRIVRTTAPKYNFFGLEEDAEMAEYLFTMIKESLEFETKKFQRSRIYTGIKVRGGKRSALVSFKDGFARTLRFRLSDLRNEQDRTLRQQAADVGETDIVILKEETREAKFAEQIGIHLVRATSYARGGNSSEGYAAGRNSANSVNLSRPIGGYSSTGRLMLV